MIYEQTFLIVQTLPDYPEGLTLNELKETLLEKYPKYESIKQLFVPNCGYTFLKSILEDLDPCVHLIGDKYIYDQTAEKYSSHDLTNDLLTRDLDG